MVRVMSSTMLVLFAVLLLLKLAGVWRNRDRSV